MSNFYRVEFKVSQMKILSELIRRQLFTNHDVIVVIYGPDKIDKCRRYNKLNYFVKKEIKLMS